MAALPFPARLSAEMINPLQAFRNEIAPWDHREELVLDLGIGTRRVKYGARIRPRLEIQDPHSEIALNEHKGDVLHARHSQVGNEHAVTEQVAGVLLAQQTRADPPV